MPIAPDNQYAQYNPSPMLKDSLANAKPVEPSSGLSLLQQNQRYLRDAIGELEEAVYDLTSMFGISTPIGLPESEEVPPTDNILDATATDLRLAQRKIDSLASFVRNSRSRLA